VLNSLRDVEPEAQLTFNDSGMDPWRLANERSECRNRAAHAVDLYVRGRLGGGSAAVFRHGNGLDDWPASDMEEIREDRLLRVVRHVLGAQCGNSRLRRCTRMRPVHCSAIRPETGAGGGVSALARVYAMPAAGAIGRGCSSSAPTRTGRSVRASSTRTARASPEPRRSRRVSWLRARTAIDDFPGASTCMASDACQVPWNCAMSGQRRGGRRHAALQSVPETQANGPGVFRDGKAALPGCRGRHPHLRVAPLENATPSRNPSRWARPTCGSRGRCRRSPSHRRRSVGAIGGAGSDVAAGDVESERDVKLVRKGQARYDKYTDAQIWAAIEK